MDNDKKRFNYCMINNNPPEYIINDEFNMLSSFKVPSMNKAARICELLNSQFSKPDNINDDLMNDLAYYCMMIFEMFLTVNIEYAKLGKGTTHHEIVAAGTEKLANEYYYNGFRKILKELGYDKNIGDDLSTD